MRPLGDRLGNRGAAWLLVAAGVVVWGVIAVLLVVQAAR